MRFTRLLVVALCATLLCASLGGALSESADVDALLAGDVWQGLTIKATKSAEFDSDDHTFYRCAMFSSNPVYDFDGNKVKCRDADGFPLGFLPSFISDAIRTLDGKLLVQRRPLDISMTDPGRPCARFNLAAEDVHDKQGGFILYQTFRPAGADGRYLRSIVCSWDAVTGRPTSGVINIAAQYPYNSVSGKRGLTAEILRMLGFNTTVFANKNMVTRATVRGVENVPLVNSPMVLQMARDFYGCRTLPGMELDYDSTNDNAPLPYWRGRVAKDDVMSSAGNMTYVTPMTIAALEDTGFYKGNYDNADLMPWGYKAGCDFVTQKCMEGGKSSFGNLFCADGLSSSPAWKCTSDRRAIGHCGMVKASGDLPSPFQYFADATEGGSLSTMDYCPVVQADMTTSCIDSEAYVLPHYVSDKSARCFDAQDTSATYKGSALDATCLPVTCDATSQTYTVALKSRYDSTRCPAGTTIDLSSAGGSGMLTKGTLTCPPYDQVCVQHFTPSTESSDHASESSGSKGHDPSSSASHENTVSAESTVFIHRRSRDYERMLIGVVWMCVLVFLVGVACLHTLLCNKPPFACPL